MSLPAALKFECEFIAGSGTYVDITAYVDMGVGFNIQWGRSSPYSDAQIATLDGLQLKNADGRFTPQSALLNDPVTFAATTTANPYYPNVLPRRRFRVSYTISAVTYYVFWGYIRAWPPMVYNGIRPYVPITAVDRGALLAGIQGLRPAAVQAMLIDSPFALFPFDEPSGAVAFTDIVSGYQAGTFGDGGVNTVVTSGAQDPLPFSDGSTGLHIQAGMWIAPQNNGGPGQQGNLITPPAALATNWSVEGWITVDIAGAGVADLCMVNAAGIGFTGMYLQTTSFGTAATYTDAAGTNTLHGNPVLDGLPHHYAVTGSDSAGTLTVKLYQDGVLLDTKTQTGGSSAFTAPIFFGSNRANDYTPGGNEYGPCAFYASTLSATRVAQHYYGGTGGRGQTTGARIVEYLTWAGVATADQAIATGVQTVTQHAVAGKNILTICQDMAATEGGGAVFYHDMNGGKSTFLDRNYRNGSTPAFTLDAEKDLRNDAYAPSFDDLTLVNQSTLTKGDGASQTYTDTTARAAYGLSTDYSSSEVYPDSLLALLNLAQERVASQAYPAFRLGQVTVPLATAQTAGLYAAYGTLKIGGRIRVSNLMPGKTAPRASVDVYAEGAQVTVRIDRFDVVFDSTPADNPYRWIWDTSRWAPIAGDSTLNASITNSATALAIAWVIGPKWTTTGGSYPLFIQIDEEIIQLTAVPGGSTSPQSYTGCVRAQQGTRAAAHTAGAVIRLWPDYRWQL